MINIFSGAQIFRMLVTNSDKSSEERTQLLENKFASVVKKHFSEYNLVNDIQFFIQYFSFHKERKNALDTSPQCIFFPHLSSTRRNKRQAFIFKLSNTIYFIIQFFLTCILLIFIVCILQTHKRR